MISDICCTGMFYSMQNYKVVCVCVCRHACVRRSRLLQSPLGARLLCFVSTILYSLFFFAFLPHFGGKKNIPFGVDSLTKMVFKHSGQQFVWKEKRNKFWNTFLVDFFFKTLLKSDPNIVFVFNGEEFRSKLLLIL